MKTFSIPIEGCSINFDPLTHYKDIADDKTLSLREDFKNLSGMSCTVNLFVLLHQRVGSFVATSKFQNQLEELPINYSKRHFFVDWDYLLFKKECNIEVDSPLTK